MAKKKGNEKAVITLVLTVVAAYLLYRYWPRIKSAAGGPSAGASPIFPPTYPRQQGYSGGRLPAGSGGGLPFSFGKNPFNALANFVSNVRDYGWAMAKTLPVTYPDLSGLSIPLQPFNWGGFSPSDFLVTSDVPGAGSGSPGVNYLDPGSIDSQSFDWGGYSPNDFLVTQNVPASDPYWRSSYPTDYSPLFDVQYNDLSGMSLDSSGGGSGY